MIALSLPLRLRRRRAADDSFIFELAGRAFGEYAPDAAASTLRMARAGETWLACRGEQALGFAVVRSAGSVAELCAIAVDESARGAGVGRALLRDIERQLWKDGIRELRLRTAEANLSALQLFLKLGFRVEQRLPRFYRGVFDAFALCKKLAVAR